MCNVVFVIVIALFVYQPVFCMNPTGKDLQKNLKTLKSSLGNLKVKLETLSSKLTGLKTKLEEQDDPKILEIRKCDELRKLAKRILSATDPDAALCKEQDQKATTAYRNLMLRFHTDRLPKSLENDTTFNDAVKNVVLKITRARDKSLNPSETKATMEWNEEVEKAEIYSGKKAKTTTPEATWQKWEKEREAACKKSNDEFEAEMQKMEEERKKRQEELEKQQAEYKKEQEEKQVAWDEELKQLKQTVKLQKEINDLELKILQLELAKKPIAEIDPLKKEFESKKQEMEKIKTKLPQEKTLEERLAELQAKQKQGSTTPGQNPFNVFHPTSIDSLQKQINDWKQELAEKQLQKEKLKPGLNKQLLDLDISDLEKKIKMQEKFVKEFANF